VISFFFPVITRRLLPHVPLAFDSFSTMWGQEDVFVSFLDLSSSGPSLSGLCVAGRFCVLPLLLITALVLALSSGESSPSRNPVVL